jgi:large-conductance mechanosensitive channel
MPFNVTRFIVEEGIISITIGTTIAFAVNNYIKSFRTDILLPLIKKYMKLNVFYGDFLSSTMEFGIILMLVYLSYRFLIYPLFKHELEKDKEKQQQQLQWKDDVLNKVHSIDNKILNVNYGI